LFSLEILIDECVQFLKQKFPSANIKAGQIQEMPEILADYSAIRSVIINLLENAIKYSDSVPEINIGLTSTNERCNIEISDLGIGIAPNERKKIFEKFYRIGNEDQRKTKGTGLGLYIVDQIVRAHNGTITVSSNQPKGTIFNIFLPFN
jgi:signal transduction histidine kinase